MPPLRHAARLLVPPVLLLLATSACGLEDANARPVIIAHRLGAGLAPENSRTALDTALAHDFQGIEIDLVLTADRVPVLAHDVWMSPDYCTRADGSPLEADRINIPELTLEVLLRDYRCGGVAQEDHPDAVVKADTHVTFDELLGRLHQAPEMLVQLDIKYDPEKTADAQTYAEEILGRWRRANLPNPVFASATLPELLRAFREEMPELETTLIWPYFKADTNSTTTAVADELTTRIGVESVADRILAAKANGAGIAWQVADRQAVERLRDEGFKVQLWTVNGQTQQENFCRWPVDALITDYPEDVPCR